MKPKLNPTVSVVKITETVLEFFKTNTRTQVRLQVEDDTVMSLVCSFDGTKTIDEISSAAQIERDDVEKLVHFMINRGLLDNVTPNEDFKDYEIFRRTIHFIADDSASHDDLVEMWNNIYYSTVLVIGLGAVGTWVACNLVQMGVHRIILMDGDVVEPSNFHRQFGFDSECVGQYKVDALERRLKNYSPTVVVQKSYDYLVENNLHQFDNVEIDLIVNCADKPNVDTTSLWVGEYAMQRRIPHIVGGGYNLHLSLIGQTILPGKTACVKCFKKHLEEENQIDTKKVKKLNIKNRKIGSFGPMCSMIASMVGMEAIKILSRKIQPSNVDRRGEFDILKMNLSYKVYKRREDCEWCGKKGKYSHS